MKVLIPLDLFYPSRIGGPANTLFWLGQALSHEGHEIFVVTTIKGIEKNVKKDTWHKIHESINVRYCKTKNKIPLKVIWHSARLVRSVDTVLFSSICFIPNFFIALVALFFGKNIIWSPRGELFDSAINGNKSKLLYFKLISFIFGNKVHFHATSNAEKDLIIRYFYKAKVSVIPNYLILPEKQSINSNFDYLLFVGRIAPIKAIDKIIEGLANSRLFKKSRFQFKIVGGVETQFLEYRKSLQQLIKKYQLEDKVIFEGSITGVNKDIVYAKARFLLLMSHSENFGNVVIESLAQGTPVVASKGTPWEKLSDNNAGFWIDNSPETIAHVIDYIIQQDDSSYLKMRDSAYKYSQTFDVFAHITEWETLLFGK